MLKSVSQFRLILWSLEISGHQMSPSWCFQGKACQSLRGTVKEDRQNYASPRNLGPWSTLTLKKQQTLILAFFFFLLFFFFFPFNPFPALSAPTQWAQVQKYTPTACHPAQGKQLHEMAARALATETLMARLEVQPAGRWPMAS